METAIIYFKKSEVFEQNVRSLTDSDCYEIARRLNRLISDGAKGSTLEYQNDRDENLKDYCADSIISVAPCTSGVFAIVRIKKKE